MLSRFSVPVLGFAAYSGTGKTTLLRELLPQLHAHDLKIGVIKHAHHDFDIDIPGKDSYELRKAGASQMLVASRNRQALITETSDGPEPRLDELLKQFNYERLDLILIEGFKKEPIPKIELHRTKLAHPPLYKNDRSIIALATDGYLTERPNIPILDLNRPEQITEFILQKFFSSESASCKLAFASS